LDTRYHETNATNKTAKKDGSVLAEITGMTGYIISISEEMFTGDQHTPNTKLWRRQHQSRVGRLSWSTHRSVGRVIDIAFAVGVVAADFAQSWKLDESLEEKRG
jgi:hypothetical protein